jgi:hypothetical protein
MKRRLSAWLAAGLLFAPALFAQTAPAEARPWIQAELIVFRYLDTASAADEEWPAKPALGYPESVQFLVDPASPDTLSAAPGAVPPPEVAAATGASPPVAFERVADAQRLLGDAARRIGGSQNYRLLAYLAWRQPAPDPGKADHVVVTGGAPHGEHWELEGYVSLSRANFVHVDTHLWLNDFALATGGAGAAPAADGVTLPAVPLAPVTTLAAGLPPIEAGTTMPDAAGAAAPAEGEDGAAAGITVEPGRATRSVLLAANRRLAPGEVHYIDHPLFGAVLRIDPWDPNAPEAAATGAAAPDAASPAAAPAPSP